MLYVYSTYNIKEITASVSGQTEMLWGPDCLKTAIDQTFTFSEKKSEWCSPM